LARHTKQILYSCETAPIMEMDRKTLYQLSY